MIRSNIDYMSVDRPRLVDMLEHGTVQNRHSAASCLSYYIDIEIRNLLLKQFLAEHSDYVRNMIKLALREIDSKLPSSHM